MGAPFRPIRPDLFDSSQFSYSHDRGVYATGSSSGANSGQVDVSPSNGDSFTATSVAAAWVGATSKIVATIADHPAGASAEEAAAEGVIVGVGALSAGVGFTLYLHSPDGATGPYRIHYLGV